MTVTSTIRPTWPTPPVAAGQSRGPVLAAVDDSSLALPVVRRAAAVAAAEKRELVLVTVVPSGAPDPLVRLTPAIAGLAVQPLVVVAEYQARGGQRRRSRRVGATILRVARAQGAAVIVIGLPDHEHQRDRSVSRRIAHGAPAATRVALVTRTEAVGPYERPVTTEITETPLPARATHAAMDVAERRRVARRAHRLQSVELPRLRRALVSDALPSNTPRADIAARYEAGLTELRILQHQLDTTPPW
jgi:nucleotide-binding universal stress UspA family protein